MAATGERVYVTKRRLKVPGDIGWMYYGTEVFSYCAMCKT
jgi:hypothetical protein